MAARRVAIFQFLIGGTAANGGIQCDSRMQNLCRVVEDKAREIFGDTMGGNFSLLVGHRSSGRLLSANFGMSPDDEVVIASASKMLSAAAILWQVDQSSSGVSMSTPVKEYLPWWKPLGPDDPRGDVTLEHMLSQTDGFGESPTFNFSEDGPTIFAKDYASLATPPKIFTILKIENYTHKMSIGPNRSSPYVWGKTQLPALPRPGKVFYYEETHWRMAETAIKQISGKGLDNVTADLANKFGMKNSHLENIPSLGGPEWISTCSDLEKFLQHVANRDFLKEATQTAFESAHTNDADWYGFKARPDWGYAMGSWSHCPHGGCSQLSSIGLFGTMPVVDLTTGLYFALVRPAGVDPQRGVLMDRSVAFWEALSHVLNQGVAAAVQEQVEAVLV
jgi:CubicO group peptidase (beta-lactamase class C family)